MEKSFKFFFFVILLLHIKSRIIETYYVDATVVTMSMLVIDLNGSCLACGLSLKSKIQLNLPRYLSLYGVVSVKLSKVLWQAGFNASAYHFKHFYFKLFCFCFFLNTVMVMVVNGQINQNGKKKIPQ